MNILCGSMQIFDDFQVNDKQIIIKTLKVKRHKLIETNPINWKLFLCVEYSAISQLLPPLFYNALHRIPNVKYIEQLVFIL